MTMSLRISLNGYTFSSSLIYTVLQNKRERWFSAPPLWLDSAGSIVWVWDFAWENIFWGSSKILIWTIVKG